MPSPFDYNAVLSGLGSDFGDVIRQHLERQRAQEAFNQFMSGITQQQTTTTPVQAGTFPAQAGSGGPGLPTRLPVAAQPIMGVDISRQNVQLPPSDPRFINTAMQYLQSSPGAAGTLKTYLDLRKSGMPTYGTIGTPTTGVWQIPENPDTGQATGPPKEIIAAQGEATLYPRQEIGSDGKPRTEFYSWNKKTQKLEKVSEGGVIPPKSSPFGMLGEVKMDDKTVDGLVEMIRTQGMTALSGLGGMMGAAGVKMRTDILKKYFEKYPTTNPALIKPYYDNTVAAAKQMTARQVAAESYIRTATDNADLALKASDTVQRSQSPLVNRFLLWNQKNIAGGSNVTAFETYVYTFAREYARVTTNPTLGAQALTDTASKKADEIISASLNPDQLKSTIEAMKNDMNNVNNEMKNELQDLQGRLQNIKSSGIGETGGGFPPTEQPKSKKSITLPDGTVVTEE